MKYGIYDTRDHCWIGDDDGPRLFDDPGIAGIAAQVADEQLGNPIGTCRSQPYDDQPKRLKDTLPVKRSALSALQRIEGKIQ